MLKVVIKFSILTFILFTIMGCGGGVFINKDYVYKPFNPMVQLAIIPVPDNNASFIDSAFALIFEDSIRGQNIIPPGVIRNNMVGDQQLVELINKLGSAEYSKEDLKLNPSVLSTLSDEEFAYLKQQLGQPAVVLFPISFGIKSFGVITSGHSKMRLYDFEFGTLIYEHSMDINVELGGDEGIKYMAAGLVGFAKDDYNKFFRDKFLMKE